MKKTYLQVAQQGDPKSAKDVAPESVSRTSEDVAPETRESVSRNLKKAAAKGHVEAVKRLLLHPLVDPTYDVSSTWYMKRNCVEKAVLRGHVEVLKVLLEDGRAQPSDSTLNYSLGRGNVEIARLLLKDGRVAPVEGDLECAQTRQEAAFEAVKMLLEDGRASDWNDGLARAAKTGRLDLIELFLLDGRASPTVGLNRACEQGRLDAVELFLRDGRADLSRALIEAVGKGGCREVVELLLRDEKVDPCVMESECLFRAVGAGRCDFLEILLKDGRAEPRSRIIGEALRGNQPEMVKMLLEDGRADPRELLSLFGELSRLPLERERLFVPLSKMRESA